MIAKTKATSKPDSPSGAPRVSRVAAARLTPESLEFLRKASRQKRGDWLDRNREDYERVIRAPLNQIARTFQSELRPQAPGYHFPQKGLGRLKRSERKAKEYGSFFRGWLSYTATRPSKSRFDTNPTLFLMINPFDEDGDEVLLCGGLYMPSSRQLRTLRERISENPAPFESLFADDSFAARFPEGFSDERISSRVPRGFDPNHSHLHWLRLQGFFAWRSYSKRQYAGVDFATLLVADARELLRLNDLLERALEGRWPASLGSDLPTSGIVSGLERAPTLDDVQPVRYRPDF